MRRTVLTLSLATAMLAAAVPAAQAATKQKVRILGFTTFPRLGVPAVQARPGRTLTQCQTRAPDNREINFVWQATGIPRSARVGVALWGGSPRAGFDRRPTVAEVAKTARRWGKDPRRIHTSAYGYTFGPTGFGPQNIDGIWSAMVVVNGKSVAFGKVTVACA